MKYVSLAREFAFTQVHFDKLREELYDYAGIVLADSKIDMAYNRLVRRLRDLNLQSFDEYFDYLESEPLEFTRFINALTTNLSSFYREAYHFDFIKQYIIPSIKEKNINKIRAWSAGCSYGEEPYSIAMSLLDFGVDVHQWDVKILATDIDSKALENAETGVYNSSSVENLDKSLVKRWFLKGKGQNTGLVKVRSELRDLIHFRRLNLMENWPIKGPLDFIFCRNVMIYFDQPTQVKLISKMADLLKPEGILFVGHSEAITHHTHQFELIGKTIYRKLP